MLARHSTARPLLLALAAALCLGAGSARAEPSSGDAIKGFLLERGLLDPARADLPLTQQVRERAVQASNWASELVVAAMNFLGVDYRRGGNSVETGFDCSGFTRHVFESSIGLVLPRRSAEQAKAPGLAAVKRDELEPGDLVFFNTLRAAFSHVGIYVGDGKFIHAPRTGGQVRVEDMRVAYWSKRYNGARRASLPTAETASVAPAPVPAAPAFVSTAAPAGAGPTTLNPPPGSVQPLLVH
ncbi:C40 family peptidase [uncultured Methylibium sp.]|uniref:C40 family peptidase n=1 Tax=uncultured Methylibium sp. TaxID=381093 RepID=UPI0025DA2133|nr:C40 family peptidase [uncultured Methylibium sp.]